jgi:hypothetical protein
VVAMSARAGPVHLGSSAVSDAPRLRHAVRVLLLDERDRVLLFRGEEPDTGRAFWFPAGGGVEEGEDVQSAACARSPRRPAWRTSTPNDVGV